MNGVISGLNFIGDAGYQVLKSSESVLKKSASLIAPVGLGMIGTKFLGTGANYGLIQGLTSGLIHQVILIPGNRLINRYKEGNAPTGTQPLRKPAIYVLKTAGTAIEIFAAPIITFYAAKKILNVCSYYSPAMISRFLSSEHQNQYTIWNGLLASAIPSLLQIAIEAFSSDQK